MNIRQIFIITLILTTNINSVFSAQSDISPQTLMSLKDAKKQFAKSPEKLQTVKKQIQAYYEPQNNNQESVYEKEVRLICNNALETHFKTHKVTEKSALIFDIDETVLSDYQLFKEKNFEWTTDDYCDFRLKKACTPILPTRDFFLALKNLGFKIIFLTSRRDTHLQATQENLAAYGYTYDELFLLPTELLEQHVSHAVWKLQIRKELSKKYDIVGSISDSLSDFEGGYCGVTVKLPNYLY